MYVVVMESAEVQGATGGGCNHQVNKAKEQQITYALRPFPMPSLLRTAAAVIPALGMQGMMVKISRGLLSRSCAFDPKAVSEEKGKEKRERAAGGQILMLGDGAAKWGPK